MPRFPHILRLPSKLRRRARRQRMATLLALLALCALLLAPFYCVYKPPRALISFFTWRWPDVLWRVDLQDKTETDTGGGGGTGSELPIPQKLVALTIDDAPSEHTLEILSILKEHGAHATFFVIGGQVSGRKAVLRDVLAAGGHELGNHGMHDEMARSLSDEELEQQIRMVQGMLEEIYGSGEEDDSEDGPKKKSPPRLFRPGSGFFSTRMRELVRRLGYQLVLGSVYPHDAQIGYPSVNARHILSMLRPGAIVICHDRRSWTPPMLRQMLPEAIRRGYRFVTVTELLAQGK